MKICVLVKEVPGPSALKRMDRSSGRLDRSGEGSLNRFDTHALEAAVQVREGGDVAVEEIVAITMGPPGAARVLEKAVSLGADRTVLVTDPALAGSCAIATGRVLGAALRRERPDLVLLGQQADDGECYAMAAIVAEHLEAPALTQVTRLDVGPDRVRCERQSEYGHDTVEIDLPAVVSVGDAVNEPRYPSLQAIMAGRESAPETLSLAELGLGAEHGGLAGSRTRVLAVSDPPPRPPGIVLREIDPDVAVSKVVAWLDERQLL